MVVGDPGDAGELFLDLRRLAPENALVLPVDADHDWLLGAGQDLLDTFVEIALDVAVQARVAGRDGTHRGHGLVVVGIGVDADPVLPKVDSGHLLTQEGLPDMRAEAANTGDRTQVPAHVEGPREGILRIIDADTGRDFRRHREAALPEVAIAK